MIYVIWGIVFIVGIWVISTYNTLTSLRLRIDNAWRQIDVQLKRRYDLIPNLIETVKGYMQFEQDTLQKVIDARSQAMGSKGVKDSANAQAALTQSFGQVFALMENYPDLKSNQNFLALQSQLEGTENRITVARRDYIEAVRAYNTELKTFPGVLWAATFFRSNKPMAEFAANENAQTPPQVKF